MSVIEMPSLLKNFFILEGFRGEGKPARRGLQGADQDADREAEAGRGQGRVRRKIRSETAERGQVNLCII